MLLDQGLFAGTSLSPADLARDLVARYEDEWGALFDPTHEWADLLLLRYDTSRVWWKDIEGL